MDQQKHGAHTHAHTQTHVRLWFYASQVSPFHLAQRKFISTGNMQGGETMDGLSTLDSEQISSPSGKLFDGADIEYAIEQ
jgi:hypothetical protein